MGSNDELHQPPSDEASSVKGREEDGRVHGGADDDELAALRAASPEEFYARIMRRPDIRELLELLGDE